MKEIDKIRIRQWNQDNPYIQMKNLENAQPGYRVHTVNDDHHLYELPLETQNIILDWVFWNFYPAHFPVLDLQSTSDTPVEDNGRSLIFPLLQYHPCFP